MTSATTGGAGRGMKALLLTAGVGVVFGALFLLGRGGGDAERAQQVPPPRLGNPGDRQPLEPPKHELQVGEKAPPLSLPDLEGRMTSLDEWKGKVLVVNVWASWCPPCVREMPSLQKLHEQAGADFAVVGVSVDDTRPDARKLVDKMGVKFPVLLDVGGVRMQAWGTVKYPETWILDRAGIVRARVIGEDDWSSPQVLAELRLLATTGS